MTDHAHLADHYIAAWNETDPARRAALLADHWTDDADYVDPMVTARGHAHIGIVMGSVQAQFPGFRFRLDGKVDGYGDKLRFSWTLGPDTDPDMIRGTDFAVLHDGRLKSVTGFLDKLPATT